MKTSPLFHPTRKGRQPYICHLCIHLGCERQKSNPFGSGPTNGVLAPHHWLFWSLVILWYHLKIQENFNHKTPVSWHSPAAETTTISQLESNLWKGFKFRSKFISIISLTRESPMEHLGRGTQAETQTPLSSNHARGSLECCSHRLIRSYSQLQGQFSDLHSSLPVFCVWPFSPNTGKVAQCILSHLTPGWWEVWNLLAGRAAIQRELCKLQKW